MEIRIGRSGTQRKLGGSDPNFGKDTGGKEGKWNQHRFKMGHPQKRLNQAHWT